jgi:ribosomal protein S6--L-glutamate ligase
MAEGRGLKLAIGVRPRRFGAQGFHTLGFRQPTAYSPEEWRLIHEAPLIYYPTTFYAPVFAAMGKKSFPGAATYLILGDKLTQAAVFSFRGVPMPRTGIFPAREIEAMEAAFGYPVVAKLPRGQSRGRGVFLIRGPEELETYLGLTRTAYLQEYLDLPRDLRVVIFARRPVHAYWRLRVPGDFRTNVALGGAIELGGIPEEALDFAARVAETCQIDEAGLDLCFHEGKWGGRWLMLEANVLYGTEGFAAAGLDYKKIVKEILESSEIEDRLLRGV